MSGMEGGGGDRRDLCYTSRAELEARRGPYPHPPQTQVASEKVAMKPARGVTLTDRNRDDGVPGHVTGCVGSFI